MSQAAQLGALTRVVAGAVQLAQGFLGGLAGRTGNVDDGEEVQEATVLLPSGGFVLPVNHGLRWLWIHVVSPVVQLSSCWHWGLTDVEGVGGLQEKNCRENNGDTFGGHFTGFYSLQESLVNCCSYWVSLALLSSPLACTAGHT